MLREAAEAVGKAESESHFIGAGHAHSSHAARTQLEAGAGVGKVARAVAALESAATNSQKEEAARALGNLGGNADNQVAIARAGAIAPLVALLSGGGTDAVKEEAAKALQILARNNDNKVAIARAGAIAPLKQMKSQGSDAAKSLLPLL